MELKQAFDKVLEESMHMALGTCVEGRPNVRIVTYGTSKARPGRLFFTTFKGNRKVEEFAVNDRVACMPLPMGPGDQVRIFGRVRQADISLADMIDMVSGKTPEDAETLRQGGEMLTIYEVVFTEGFITVGMSPAQKVEV